MKKKLVFLLLVSLILIMSLFTTGNDKVVRLTSLEWPPYTGSNLDNLGASIEVAKKAFEAMGYTLKVDIYPWQRAVNLAKSSNNYIGYFPEYYADYIKESFYFSNPMGDSPLGFAQRKNNKIKWTKLTDLKKYNIGTVQGYVNTAEFDKMAENKTLKVFPAVDDVTNLKKLIAKRLDLVVIDKNVMNYLLNTDSSLKNNKNEVEFNSKLLEMKKLYICFRKNSEGKKMLQIFNNGLKKINVKEIMNNYFQKVF